MRVILTLTGAVCCGIMLPRTEGNEGCDEGCGLGCDVGCDHRWTPTRQAAMLMLNVKSVSMLCLLMYPIYCTPLPVAQVPEPGLDLGRFDPIGLNGDRCRRVVAAR